MWAINVIWWQTGDQTRGGELRMEEKEGNEKDSSSPDNPAVGHEDMKHCRRVKSYGKAGRLYPPLIMMHWNCSCWMVMLLWLRLFFSFISTNDCSLWSMGAFPLAKMTHRVCNTVDDLQFMRNWPPLLCWDQSAVGDTFWWSCWYISLLMLDHASRLAVCHRGLATWQGLIHVLILDPKGKPMCGCTEAFSKPTYVPIRWYVWIMSQDMDWLCFQLVAGSGVGPRWEVMSFQVPMLSHVQK